MTSGQATSFALIMFLTGVGIPILAALNGGLGARLGSPMAASVILFGLALLIALAGAAATESLGDVRSEEQTSELQSLMRISYAVFCLKKKKPETRKTKQQRPT